MLFCCCVCVCVVCVCVRVVSYFKRLGAFAFGEGSDFLVQVLLQVPQHEGEVAATETLVPEGLTHTHTPHTYVYVRADEYRHGSYDTQHTHMTHCDIHRP